MTLPRFVPTSTQALLVRVTLGKGIFPIKSENSAEFSQDQSLQEQAFQAKATYIHLLTHDLGKKISEKCSMQGFGDNYYKQMSGNP